MSEWQQVASGYHEGSFYKMEQCKTFDIPTVTEVIAVDNDLHVKLFLSGSPLPRWFSKGKDCRMTKKSYPGTLFTIYKVFQKSWAHFDNEYLGNY